MTVYVDNALIEATVPNGSRTVRGKWCHLFSHPDDHAELHALAARIGLRRSWFQKHHNRREMWHYDVVKSKRAEAVAAGAVEVGWLEGARLMKEWWTAREAATGEGVT